MNMLRKESPFGDTIFCEDIRFEVGGRNSLIGVMHGEIIVPLAHPGPFMLPKLCMLMTYAERVGEGVTDSVEIRIYFPGDPDDTPSTRISVPVEPLRLVVAPAELLSDDPFSMAAVPLVMSPVVLKHEGKIKVRAVRGDTVVRLGSLTIRTVIQAPQIQSA